MTAAQQRAAAEKFAKLWAGRGYEKGDSQIFWTTLLQDVYGVEDVASFIVYEEQVHLDHTSFIDGHIPSTHVLIEQKSLGKSLRAPILQSDGTKLTPFQQAKRYSADLPYSQRPRWIVTCNFGEFLVYDMEQPNGEPISILLENLPDEYYRLEFLVKTGNEHLEKEKEISIEAGKLVGILYDKFRAQYKNPDSPDSLRSLNMLCVRLVFCLYAEDAGLFGHHGMFHDYIKAAGDISLTAACRALIDLFRVLNQKPEERDPYMDEALAAFPYVNGGLFADERIEIPSFSQDILDALLSKASGGFNWAHISPTIFGAVFESTLNPETRRKGGMHYTSIENIHKVIDPLFLDALKEELESIKETAVERTRRARLQAFQKKLASLTFLDPAAGSGNFLTETYVSLRRLENEVLEELSHLQLEFGDENYTPVMVSIGQFSGIEINDFAVTVAKTALWIAENQMLEETKKIVYANIDFLPLKSYANIVEGNALQMDWETVTPKAKLSYIMGNPPFVGKKEQTKEQKDDLVKLMGAAAKKAGSLDYVAGWYIKAAKMMQGARIKSAFVSTNSITQGEQVEPLWDVLLNQYHTHINFAYRTFKWESEAALKAAVHCVIIGFSTDSNSTDKKIYSNDKMAVNAVNINPYLIDAPNTLIAAKSKPICSVPEIVTGNQATDDGNFFISATEYESFLAEEPCAKDYLRVAYNSQGFINGKHQYCLWLVGISPTELRKMPTVLSRVEKVRQFRLSSPKEATRKQADTPTLFTEIRQPTGNYIVIPKVSSENRRYIPLGFLSPDIICNNTIKFVPDAGLYHLGILSSNVHNAWMRAVAGRLKSDYQYSNTIVYNNFPWPTPTAAQQAKIEQTAQAILAARALYPDASLADLYDDLAMPVELRKAHQANDRAVMAAYGFDVKTTTETSCVAHLMTLYQEMTES